MFKFMFTLLIALFIAGDAKAGLMQAQDNLKYAVDKPRAKVNLAKAMWQDQDQEGAYRTFLEALESAPLLKKDLDPEEEIVYQKALSLYLNHKAEEAKKYGENLKKLFLDDLKAHPEWSRLKLLVAMADANSQNLEVFFDRFYEAYQYEPDHFLSYKTQAILNIKLFERAKTEKDKERIRSILRQLINKAASIYPGDFSLYRLEIAYAPPLEKDGVKEHVLNKILSLSMIPPRGDTLYFLNLALENGNPELVSRWLKKARKWYPDSRSIQQLGPFDGN